MLQLVHCQTILVFLLWLIFVEDKERVSLIVLSGRTNIKKIKVL